MRLLGTLALTHSSRRTNLARCSVQFLTGRFGDPGRLSRLPPFDSLPPPEPLYCGAASFHEVLEDGQGRLRFRPAGSFRHRDKVQHVAWMGKEMLVGFEQRVEIWRVVHAASAELRPRPGINARARQKSPLKGTQNGVGFSRLLLRSPGIYARAGAGTGMTVTARIEHPLLAGLHTVVPMSENRALLSCSASDALLVLDLGTGGIEKVLRMPEDLYGSNYDLGPETDLRRHYVGDEQQTTHVNAAHPFDAGRRAVVSTLIQGAVGVFDLETGAYEEIARGFVGCHGARVSAEGEVYFADSAAGHLVFLDGRGRIARRFDAGSRWLHDAQQIRGGVYAFALADANELRVWDVDREELLYRRRFLTWPVEGLFGLARRAPFWLGNSTQALSFTPAA
ncbi:MAG TPA: hypothetical protein VHC97_13750 [Thermoanaerobaculia bacterium]|jgi:hypothetical protein|nr:hypothetical protein [Thermoanaerobaculia bacterium]